MIELPEANVLAAQIKKTLVGKTIVAVKANANPHGFAWFTGDPAEYDVKLTNRKITGSAAYGGRPEIWAEEMRISFCDGVRPRFHEADEKRPKKHQLLLDFDDETALSCSIQMYGGMFAFADGECDNVYYISGKEKISPLSDDFNEAYFDDLWKNVKQTISVKAFLATEQRIPGLGNGVLQDVLWNAKVHPRRRLNSVTDNERVKLYNSVKATLREMTDGGGRDIEKDLFGNPGGYKTILSKKTLAYPCLECGSGLVREAYLGGNIYYCPTCQPK